MLRRLDLKPKSPRAQHLQKAVALVGLAKVHSSRKSSLLMFRCLNVVWDLNFKSRGLKICENEWDLLLNGLLKMGVSANRGLL